MTFQEYFNHTWAPAAEISFQPSQCTNNRRKQSKSRESKNKPLRKASVHTQAKIYASQMPPFPGLFGLNSRQDTNLNVNHGIYSLKFHPCLEEPVVLQVDYCHYDLPRMSHQLLVDSSNFKIQNNDFYYMPRMSCQLCASLHRSVAKALAHKRSLHAGKQINCGVMGYFIPQHSFLAFGQIPTFRASVTAPMLTTEQRERFTPRMGTAP
jgi:hypothetical protein